MSLKKDPNEGQLLASKVSLHSHSVSFQTPPKMAPSSCNELENGANFVNTVSQNLMTRVSHPIKSSVIHPKLKVSSSLIGKEREREKEECLLKGRLPDRRRRVVRSRSWSRKKSPGSGGNPLPCWHLPNRMRPVDCRKIHSIPSPSSSATAEAKCLQLDGPLKAQRRRIVYHWKMLR